MGTLHFLLPSVANSMQREFLGNNLVSWYTDIQKAYETGVKLVKVNRLGYKFIRIVSIKDMVSMISNNCTRWNFLRRRSESPACGWWFAAPFNSTASHQVTSKVRSVRRIALDCWSPPRQGVSGIQCVKRPCCHWERTDGFQVRNACDAMVLMRFSEGFALGFLECRCDNAVLCVCTFSPKATCCAVVDLPKGRSLSLIFL